LAWAFFVADGFTKDGECMTRPVLRFVEALMIARWPMIKSRVARERDRVTSLKKEVEEL
jgi:hypothetical protein